MRETHWRRMGVMVGEARLGRALKGRSQRRGATLAVLAAVALVVAQAPVSLAQAASPTIGGCPVFPPDNVWNTPIDQLPVDARSDEYVASIGSDKHLHPDFGAGLHEGAPIGIPFVVVPMNQPKVAIRFRNFE